jgi:phospholipid-binding lipoprotein MlaA
MRIRPSFTLLTATLLGGLLAGCATPPPASDPEALAEFRQTNDPIEPTNRVVYKVNDALDTVVMKPLAQGYRAVLPTPVRNGVHNFLANLTSPVTFANDVMETKPRRAGDTMMRFLINSTVGVAGVFDVATGWGYPSHDAGFATTLAIWGVPEGPYLVLPLLGPSNPRDAVGFGGDVALDPFSWAGSGTAITAFDWSRFGVGLVDQRERLLDPIDQIKKSALDPYATFRSLYRQHRRAEIEAVRNDKRATVPVWFDEPAATPNKAGSTQ